MASVLEKQSNCNSDQINKLAASQGGVKTNVNCLNISICKNLIAVHVNDIQYYDINLLHCCQFLVTWLFWQRILYSCLKCPKLHQTCYSLLLLPLFKIKSNIIYKATFMQYGTIQSILLQIKTENKKKVTNKNTRISQKY